MSNLELPNSIIQRLIRDGISSQFSAILSKDVKKAFQQLAGYYALYLYSTANDVAVESKRKKVTEQDVYQALKETGFEKFVEQLKDFMANYNADKEDQVPKVSYKKRTNAEISGATDTMRKQSEDDEDMEAVAAVQQNQKRLRNYNQSEEEEEVLDIDEADLEIIDIQTK